MPDDHRPRSDRRPANPLGLLGIEFVEYATSRPQALGQCPGDDGLQPVARHRSREVLLYRQGGMNVIVNAHAAALPPQPASDRRARRSPRCAARARRAAHRRAIERGVGGAGAGGADGAQHPGDPRRRREPDLLRRPAPRLSIYDVDFRFIPGVDRHPPALAGMHWFGIVQYIGVDRG